DYQLARPWDRALFDAVGNGSSAASLAAIACGEVEQVGGVGGRRLTEVARSHPDQTERAPVRFPVDQRRDHVEDDGSALRGMWQGARAGENAKVGGLELQDHAAAGQALVGELSGNSLAEPACYLPQPFG